MKFLICLALLFAFAQANPGIVAPLTYSAVPRVATYAASPYTAYSAYAAPAVSIYRAPIARVAAVAPAVRVAYSAPVVTTLLK